MEHVTLKPHQMTAHRDLIQHDRYLLFLDMGLGKTLTCLYTIVQMLKVDLIKRVLVVAPPQVAKHTWTNEIKKWQMPIKALSVHGTAAQRTKMLKDASDTQVFIISNALLDWALDTFGANHFDLLIVDEVSQFKNEQSKRYKALRKFKTKRFWGLTGTPAPNGYQDLFALSHMVDSGTRLGRSRAAFNRAFCRESLIYTPNGVIKKYDVSEYGKSFINDKLVDISLTMKLSDIRSDILEPVYMEHLVPLTNRKEYVSIMHDAVLNDEGLEHVMTCYTKALQLCNGTVIEGGIRVEYNHDKIDRIKAIVEQSGTESVLIFYHFIADLDSLRKAFPDGKNVKDKGAIDDFNSGALRVMFAHPRSAGHGLNLQGENGHSNRIIVWYGLNYSLEQYLQANARLYRTGQTGQVVIHHVLTENTLEQDVFNVLQTKDATQEQLFKALKIN